MDIPAENASADANAIFDGDLMDFITKDYVAYSKGRKTVHLNFRVQSRSHILLRCVQKCRSKFRAAQSCLRQNPEAVSPRARTVSDKTKRAEAGIHVTPYNNVIMHRDAERLGGFNNRFCHFYIGL